MYVLCLHGSQQGLTAKGNKLFPLHAGGQAGCFRVFKCLFYKEVRSEPRPVSLPAELHA